MTDIIIGFSRAMDDYLPQIAMGIVATLLVIYGADINRFVKRKIGNHNFFVRVGVFIVLCAVGYGLFTVFASNFLTAGLAKIDDVYLAPVVIITFIIIGIIAEQKNQV